MGGLVGGEAPGGGHTGCSPPFGGETEAGWERRVLGWCLPLGSSPACTLPGAGWGASEWDPVRCPLVL